MDASTHTSQRTSSPTSARWDWEHCKTVSPSSLRGRQTENRFPDRAPKPGTWIDQTRRVVEVLGEGTVGVVVQTSTEGASAPHAVKLLQPQLSLDSRVRRRFEGAARAMADLDHRSIVRVDSFGMWNGLPYFVMPYIDGIDLRSRLALRPGAPMSLEDAEEILTQLGGAVSALHAQGRAHGCLQARNVLLGRGRRVLLTDIGLGCLRDEPGRSVDGGMSAWLEARQQRDVAELAALAFQMLTGTAIQVGGTAPPGDEHRERARRLFARATNASEFGSSLLEPFDDVLRGVLDASGRARLPSIDEFSGGLRRAFGALKGGAPYKRIVVVDDDADIRLLLEQVLRQEIPQVEVVCVESAEAALCALRAGPTELLITDLKMPSVTGLELVAFLKGGPDAQPKRYMVITGEGSAHDWQILCELGVDAFVAKPFRRDQAVFLVRQLLSEGDA